MPFKYARAKTIYKGKRVDLLKIEVNGSEKELVAHPGAVVVLPLIDERAVVLIKNQRVIVQETLWELPAGTIEKNEKPIDTAIRELEEETGYLAKGMEELLKFFSTPGFCNELLTVFVAKDLKKGNQKLDKTEKIEVEIVPLKQALEMISEKVIRDAKTIAVLLYYYTFRC